MTQEALTNVSRHARARTVLVELRRTGVRIQLNVIDDGIGFVVGEGSASSLGLRSIDERVRLVGGVVTIDTQPGRGTRLLVGIPIEAAAQSEIAG